MLQGKVMFGNQKDGFRTEEEFTIVIIAVIILERRKSVLILFYRAKKRVSSYGVTLFFYNKGQCYLFSLQVQFF